MKKYYLTSPFLSNSTYHQQKGFIQDTVYSVYRIFIISCTDVDKNKKI